MIRTIWLLAVSLLSTPALGAIVNLPLDPPIPGQTGGPPLPQLVFNRTFDFSVYAPVAGGTGLIDVSRIGDFNNPITDTDETGAPFEGIAIFGISQFTPGLLYQWVFWPGIAGTVHETVDNPASRQHLLDVPFSQDELRDTIDAFGQAHVRLVIGNSADDAPFVDAAFEFDVAPVPEPASLALLALGGFVLLVRHRESGASVKRQKNRRLTWVR